MKEAFRVHLKGGRDDEVATFEFEDDQDVCLLFCRYRNGTISSQETDFFEALVSIRRRLEAEGLVPRCYGASLNVFPSGMARDMGRGLKAYNLKLGRHAKMADLVEIFSTGPDVVPASVEAQEKFFQDWLASPKS